MNENKSVAIGLRVKKSLKLALNKIAEQETRTVSQQVEHFVKQGIEDYLKNHPEFQKQLSLNNDND
jgi:hypothetical protein